MIEICVFANNLPVNLENVQLKKKVSLKNRHMKNNYFSQGFWAK